MVATQQPREKDNSMNGGKRVQQILSLNVVRMHAENRMQWTEYLHINDFDSSIYVSTSNKAVRMVST